MASTVASAVRSRSSQALIAALGGAATASALGGPAGPSRDRGRRARLLPFQASSVSSCTDDDQDRESAWPRRSVLACCGCLRSRVVPQAVHIDPVVPLAASTSHRSSSPIPIGARSSSSAHAAEAASLSYPDGNKYEGQLVDGKRHGRGVLTLGDGTTYDADWRNDRRHGEGSELFPDGSRFTGKYADGLRSGHGVMTWPEGSRYCGQFSRGRANGEGHLLRTDGSVYKGNFSEDCMCGEGWMQWKDGVEYRGQFVANRREGVGTMKWTAGRWRSYEGDWRDGMQHGHGTLHDMHGQEYSGVFRCGKLLRWDEDTKGLAESDVSVPKVPLSVPDYWTNQDMQIGFNERKDVQEDFQAQISKLLDGTFKAVRTRDRFGQVPSSLRMVKCHRVENSAMWTRYLRAKSRVLARRPDGVKLVNELDGNPDTGFVRTQELMEDQYKQRLDARVNEHYLWHGTTPEGAIGISTNGFRLSLAGSRAGTYFGKGCYFAECSSKSDEYAREGENIFFGVYALLLCRVVCGSLFRITHSDVDAIQTALSSGTYDAVMGDREASVGTYREFVIYDEELVYPEYVVLYERKHNSPRGDT
eukprot:TRINITY_DN7458_c0_g1_i1.p1 TRINITY_DN7458_c0_g1~~TRINITY_DN7458_c0_g1_i1.p1  ORF type:complete len:587 (-),score=53.16 TRINITY_DN7458_c0_g1_i1:79-1839(-)